MIKKLLWMVFALATAAHAASFDVGTPLTSGLKPLQQQSQAAHLAAEVLARYHYKPMPLDDAMSEKIFNQYLKSLDPEKMFFVQTDIDQMSGLRTTLDDAIFAEDLTAPFAVFNLYARRVHERFGYARALLKEGFDFTKKEVFQYEREKDPWSKSENVMREVWRKRVKNDWLRLKLAGKTDKNIVEILDKRYGHSQRRIDRLKSEDVFQIFMNAYTMAIDPHSNYLGLRAAQDFDISMKLSLVGIGATLAEKDDYTTIRELVPGGPAALSGKLEIGDRIVGVSQGQGGVITDVLGWRLDDTVALIRGAAESTVLLDVLPAKAGPDGKHKLVSLIRKRITLEEQSAKKAVLTLKEGNTTRHIGLISLPSFYEDFEARQKGNQDFKSAARDVARLLGELKQEKVDAVLIDLRNNSGGSLTESIELTGLFIGKGPVVQQRDANGAVKVLRNTTSDVAWSGPLGVLINRGSASASEIFAAAIQDYGRGLVIGEPSFGKGTVQSIFNLDRLARNDKPKFGELKMTIAQFFRIDGGTTQLRGVTPDIAFPTVSDPEDFGESTFDNALPWMQVKAADYTPADNLKTLAPIILTRNEAREMNDKDFICLQEDIAESKLRRKKNQVSLNEAERRQERNIQEAQLKSCESAGKNAHGDVASQSAPAKSRALQDDGLQANERNLATELADEKARKDAKDILLNEAIHILGDEVSLLDADASFAAREKPSSPGQGAAAVRSGAL
ncbi:tail-specific protease [Sulfurimicrobium lacus]|uniref:Tail-specific protease n=1 Tax=Sulfurimicrobium lacus TaxID=2715678 RepID=A0A6F8V6N9_9PROT|nr:carboxy terminal-processing peptidase [Sulfurimicrobium lacus]BCB25358.1 tail-specific protease [Sulfurimicrobium lacus]